MAGKARVLSPANFSRILRQLTRSRFPDRNRTMVLLSFKAGLRACEMAGLDWRMVLTPSSRVAAHITISGSIAKNGTGRTIPINPELRTALERLHARYGKPVSGPVLRSQRGSHFTSRGVVNLFKQIYRDAGLDGCSSHSGRRTFITNAARQISKTGGSLRDVQELAGHRSLTTTERYIEGDREAQRKLIRLI
jgi:integrase